MGLSRCIGGSALGVYIWMDSPPQLHAAFLPLRCSLWRQSSCYPCHPRIWCVAVAAAADCSEGFSASFCGATGTGSYGTRYWICHRDDSSTSRLTTGGRQGRFAPSCYPWVTRPACLARTVDMSLPLKAAILGVVTGLLLYSLYFCGGCYALPGFPEKGPPGGVPVLATLCLIIGGIGHIPSLAAMHFLPVSSPATAMMFCIAVQLLTWWLIWYFFLLWRSRKHAPKIT